MRTPRSTQPARAYHRSLWLAKKFGKRAWS